MFARTIRVQLLDSDGPQACPLAWLDSFFMRSFTGRSSFDESLPITDGLIEASFSVDLQALKPDLEDWLTRKFGQGKPIRLTLTETPRDKHAHP